MSYLTGLEIKAGEVSKDILLDHELAKKLFGEENSSGFLNGKPDWQTALQTMSLYTDEEMSNFFMNFYEHQLMVIKFKEFDIDFTEGEKVTPSSDGSIYCYKKDYYEYFVPLYEHLTSLGFNLDTVYRGGVLRNDHTIYISSETLDISIQLKSNSFHANWWTIVMAGEHVQGEAKNDRRGYDNTDGLRWLVNEFISDTIENKFKAGGTKDIREMKAYMLLNDIEEFDAKEYLHYLANENG